MPRLSISIVNYNSGEYLLACLESIVGVRDEVDLEVSIVDNVSSDGSIEKAKRRYPDFRYILNKSNIGFGRAHNLVLKNSCARYDLVLNPDVILRKGVLKKMVEFMDSDCTVGASTCQITHENGGLDWAAHRAFPTPLASLLYFLGNDKLYHLSTRNMKQAHEVDAISGSFFLVRHAVFTDTGFFDEDYFMYAEDIDLCFRIKKAGYKIMYVPEVSVLHYKGISSGLKKHTQSVSRASVETKLRSLNAFYETMKIFYKKHLESQYPFFVNWLVYLGIDIRWWLAKNKLVV